MPKKMQYSLPFLIVVLFFSCNSKPQARELKKIPEKTPVVVAKVNAADNLASFISGLPYDKSGCYQRIDSMIGWNQYASDIDSIFSFGNRVRINKMKTWADSVLIKNKSVTTLFYPFAGPDFLNADIFYPNADQYIMIGLEPIGKLPDICSMIPDSVKSYLTSVDNTLKDIFKRSYFITSRMTDDLKKTKINGTVPLISLFIKRTGHQIVSIRRVGVDSLGNCQIVDSLKYPKNVVPGVRIDFTAVQGGKIQSVFYFRTDISDKGLKKNKGFITYLSKLPQSYTYLKAASFLLHFDDFKMIRDLIFNVSLTILQDDSGIAYKLFDKSRWDIRLFGRYSTPVKEFSYIKEPDLEKAFKQPGVKPLPFDLGYNWRTRNTSMLYAVRK
jgi:hypothetical protein